jgi:hypothetical protein
MCPSRVRSTGTLVHTLEGASLLRRVYVTGTLETLVDGGGIVSAVNGGTIEESYTDVDITITGGAGGGGGIASYFNAGTIRNSYTMGSVDTASLGVGGFVGDNSFGTVETSFSIGNIPNNGNGFMGSNSGTATANYFDLAASGKSDTVGATPLPTTGMQSLATFGAWDISTGTSTTWGIVDGSSYPYLNWEAPGGPGLRPP